MNGLICSLCLYAKPTDEQAADDDYETLTVIDGQLVCVAHAGYAGPGHNRALALLVSQQGFKTLSELQEARRG